MNELFCDEADMSGGSYIINLPKGILRTKDDEGNKFTIYTNGISYAYLTVSLDIDNPSRPTTPKLDIDNGEWIYGESKYLPPPKNYKDPLLFVINPNTNSGVE